MAKVVIERTVFWALVLVAGSLGLAGCKQQGGNAPGTGAPGGATGAADRAQVKAVKLQLNWVPEPEFGGFYAALHKGFYRDAGLDVKIEAGAAGVQTWSMVATGQVPFAIASGDELLRARRKDAGIVAVFAVYQNNPQALMVHEKSGVGSLAEIFESGKVKKVAMEAGLPYARFLRTRYRFDKVEVMQYGGNLGLFLQDPQMAVQCFVFSEPVSAREKGVAVRTFGIGESGYNPYLAVLITSEALLGEQPETVAAFVRATQRGWHAYLADPGPTNEYMRTQGATMSAAAMQLAAELQESYVLPPGSAPAALGQMSEERFRTLGEQLVALGELDRAPEAGKVFRNFPPASP
jgi:NitT/TauT family transport system substrate-binding protein